ncbi:MAG: fasciclin domain-containing protein [Phenylobacterium sp.]|uniref:fasciclin domain-containing protein n=1 Tax=Phenylobacterium sp. TaxID=1871053 RepID=UPI00391AE937
MYFNRLLTAAAAATLMAGAAQAQTAPAAPTPSETAPAAPAAEAPAATTPKVVASGDIIETARASGQFKTFIKAADATNLTGLLKQTKNLTVFAPTDAAFAALPPGELDRLMLPENKAQLQKLLTYHIVNARLDAAKFAGAKGPVPTVAGTNVEIDGSGDHVMVNDADVIQSDVMATNGIVHVIDKVLMPGAPAAAASGAPASTTASDQQQPAQQEQAPAQPQM